MLTEVQVCLICALLFTAFSVGTSLAPNLPSYFIFRMLTAFFGTPFLIIGTACLGDIFTPTARATALGWFFSGTLIGPAFGPVLGGVRNTKSREDDWYPYLLLVGNCYIQIMEGDLLVAVGARWDCHATYILSAPRDHPL